MYPENRTHSNAEDTEFDSDLQNVAVDHHMDRASIEKSEISPDAEVKDKDIDFPDGGLRAWLVVAGVCILILSLDCFSDISS